MGPPERPEPTEIVLPALRNSYGPERARGGAHGPRSEVDSDRGPVL